MQNDFKNLIDELIKEEEKVEMIIKNIVVLPSAINKDHPLYLGYVGD